MDENKPWSLLDLCLSAVGKNGRGLTPKYLRDTPRHLLMQILQSLNPFDLERLEEGDIRSLTGIDTDSLWQLHYCQQWRHKGRWPESYYQAAKNSSRLNEKIPWRVLYWQRHFQEVVNSTEAKTAVVHWHPESRSLPQDSKDGMRAKASELFLQQSAGRFGKYATYLRLHNSALTYLSTHLDIFQEFASHVEFLEIYHLRENGVDAMCSLLQILLAKNLKSVGMCFPKVRDINLWSKILHISSTGFVTSKPQVSIGKVQAVKNAKVTKTAPNPTPPATPSPTTPKPLHLYVVQGQNDIRLGVIDGSINIINEQPPSVHSNTGTTNDELISNSNDVTNGHVVSHSVTDANLSQVTSVNTPNHIKEYDNIDFYDFDEHSKDILEIQESSDHYKNGNGIEDVHFDSNDLYSEVFHKQTIDISEDASFSFHDLFGPNLLEDHHTGVTRVPPEEKEVVKEMPPVIQIPAPETPEAVGGFSFLQHFEFSSFWFHDDLLFLFAKSLRQWHNLESLVLRDNAIGFQSKGKILIDALIPLCLKGKLKYLRIEINPVDDHFVSLISEGIGTYCSTCHSGVQTSLRVLYLSSSKITALGVSHLAGKLLNKCTCPPKPSELLPHSRKFRKSLPEPLSSSKRRRLSRYSRDSLPTKITADDSSSSSDSMSSTSSSSYSISSQDSDSQDSFSQELTSLKLTKTPEPHFDGLQELTICSTIGDEGAFTLSSVLGNNSTLKYLALPSCGMHTAGLASIFRAISGESSRKCNKTLKTLILRENSYEPSHDNSLSVLLKNGKLTELDISFCGLEVLSGDVISSLGQNSSLKSLNIAGNRLGDAGLSALSQIFSQPGCSSNLTKLDLSYNQGTAASIGTLASALHKFLPKRLEEINLAGNFLGSCVSKVVSSIRPLVRNVFAGNLDSSTIYADYISQM
ncbi:uncharacterized protein LOC116290294 [Actinia tenebrosa]|uniref:Leucine-rich repeat-containing protein 41 n=1 Tax=Actinia tenebrosa TaxID=6105 RepID=A0A6P8HBZ1_ACTTE|nr:uncharacterized protein LOC116290294 [Actinia tenebrosa]XP_031553157.1 uncharacterized protein LOC116290294 [Actinia tenebrosa]